MAESARGPISQQPAASPYERANEMVELLRQGQDSFLTTLDAQRTLYAAEQAVISTRLAEQANRVTLYKALGGGWVEQQQS